MADMRNGVLSFVLAVSACGGQSARSADTPKGPQLIEEPASASGCPGIERLWHTRSSHARSEPQDAPKVWLVPTHAEMIDFDEMPKFVTKAGDAAIDKAEAELGAKTLWLFEPGGELCQASVQASYTWGGEDGPGFTERGYVLKGCEELLDKSALFALAGDNAPEACRYFSKPHVVANAAHSDDEQKPVDGGVVFPPSLSMHAKGKCSQAEHCVHRFYLQGYGPDFATAYAYDILNTWINETPGSEPCGREYDDHHRVVVHGKVLDDTSGILEGVFHAGSRTLVIRDDSERLELLQFDNGNQTGRRSFRYRVIHEEDGLFHSLAPYCGP